MTFLSDPDRAVQKDLDIVEYTDPEHNPMIPHTLVLKPGLIIHSIYNGYWFWGPAFCYRPLARSANGDQRDPSRLGSGRPRTSRSLGRRKPVGVPRLEQGPKGDLNEGTIGVPDLKHTTRTD